MVEQVVLALLSSLGIVLLCWCAAARWILPAEGDGYGVLFVRDSALDQCRVRAYLFLLRSGFIRLPLVVVDCGLPREDRLQWILQSENHTEFRFFSLQEWVDFIETERDCRVSGT